MPFKVVRDEKKCSPSKPYACINSETGKVHGCHESREAAVRQLRALYRNVPEARKMSEYEPEFISYLVPLQFAERSDWIDQNKLWLQIYPFDTWDHPLFGETTIDEDRASAIKYHFDNRIRGQDIATDYEHGLDTAKGKKASGWFRELDVRDDGLWGLVEFTDTARDEIEKGEWRYFSGEHLDTWTHPQNGQTFDYVLTGGGLTNKPWIKGMFPLNFSEVVVEKQFAEWTTAYINTLPDSCFLYVESGSKDSEGKTVPRSKRHFPYKDKNGKIDLPHLRNAIARIPQANISASLKSSLQAKARRLLGGKKTSEASVSVIDEHADVEHSEPGTGVVDPNINRDDSADEGWRRDTPPAGEDGTIPDRSDTVTNEAVAETPPDTGTDGDEGNGDDGGDEDRELRAALGIGDDDNLLDTVQSIVAKAGKYDAIRSDVEEKKAFSETFPKEAAELEQLRKEREAGIAKRFSEEIGKMRFKDSPDADAGITTMGLSALAIQTIENTARKFTEGRATLDDYRSSLEAIMNNGIVDYGTAGSSRAPRESNYSVASGDFIEGRKQFAELVANIQTQDNLDFDSALSIAAEREPDLFEAYRRPPVIAG